MNKPKDNIVKDEKKPTDFAVLLVLFLNAAKEYFQGRTFTVRQVMRFIKQWDHLDEGAQRQFGIYVSDSDEAKKVLQRTNPDQYPARYKLKDVLGEG